MSRLFVSVALLCIAMFTVEATTRDRAALDWQTFQVPEYGTHVEYLVGELLQSFRQFQSERVCSLHVNNEFEPGFSSATLCWFFVWPHGSPEW
jgi:hypothetical protein